MGWLVTAITLYYVFVNLLFLFGFIIYKLYLLLKPRCSRYCIKFKIRKSALNSSQTERYLLNDTAFNSTSKNILETPAFEDQELRVDDYDEP